MDLYSKIVEIYPILKISDFNPFDGCIELADDGDGVQYISKWDYEKPIPDGMKLGK